MKSGVLIIAGLFLLGFAAFSQAVTTVSCSGTYNMGGSGSMEFNSCAKNDLILPAGGSIVIAAGNYYCVKVTKFYGNLFSTTHKINVQLLKGTGCSAWSSGEYCYNQMFLGGACNKDLTPGMMPSMGDTYAGSYIIYHYESYLNAIATSSSPSNPTMMLFHNNIQVFGKSSKGTSGKKLPIADSVQRGSSTPRVQIGITGNGYGKDGENPTAISMALPANTRSRR